VNKLPAIRVGDPGVHAACCKKNTWKADKGSSTVYINGQAAHRETDPTKHCEVNMGSTQKGSTNVIVGG
jgi:uncharacterized Zn-binding protein involved in type VI secretion